MVLVYPKTTSPYALQNPIHIMSIRCSWSSFLCPLLSKLNIIESFEGIIGIVCVIFGMLLCQHTMLCGHHCAFWQNLLWNSVVWTSTSESYFSLFMAMIELVSFIGMVCCLVSPHKLTHIKAKAQQLFCENI